MTVRDLGWAMLRRWYVIAAALILSVVGGFLLQRGGGLYATETVVSFLLPDKTSLSLNSGLDDASVIAFAGVVAREVNDGGAPASYSTDDAPLYGAGLREGSFVSLPNAGNQWSTSYLRAELVLQIIGPSEQWVSQRQEDLLAKVVEVSDAQQSSVTAQDARIKVASVPLTKQIFHVLPSRTAVISAYVALVIAALMVGGWAAVALDRVSSTRDKVPREQMLARVSHEGVEQ
ncbi:hypothetical protein GCM10007382_18020 [Salinibacterium xinjiangense]|uniref:Uncharacterized protein n=1 Tax=Salinibacterium xinjiangense TaxID=386302 RepID=A0A2C8YQR2_9MICO|nr:hypothetical protein [Salinibacterium xinjiangense]GGK98194.1 hypothetical protein GCM10007382_18020 [Salinibacterium xinjiangense]SOE52786.1 hypothetical protein SAMN06296378_0458 [Salinibacterium xinjiangense]